MRADIFRCDAIPGLIYDVEGPSLKATVTASVTVYRVADGTETLLHSDRVILDKHAERVRFAETAGTDPDDLMIVREQLITTLTAAPEAEEPPPAPTLDPDLESAALALLDAPNVVDQLGEVIRDRGYAGDLALPKALALALCTRRLERPPNVQIDGPSSAGKTYLVNSVTALFPPSAYYEIAGSSPRALVYSPESLQHRFLIVSEADGMHHEGMGASLMRGLVWGSELRYETVESTAAGLKPVTMTKDGPTGLITTSTKGLEPELATRMLTLTVSDDPQTTRQILTATAARVNGHAPAPVDLVPWQAAQTWLDQHGCWAVTIPFGHALAARYPVHLVRARRDFKQLLELISASAVLHQRQRDRDAQGWIVVDARDYRIVYDLAGPLFGVINAGGVTTAVRRVVEAVAALVPDRDAEPATALRVAERLGIDKSVASRHISKALRAGHLLNEEGRRNQPMKLRPGDPLPEAKPALPAPDELFSTGDTQATGATVQPRPRNPHTDGESDGCTSGCSPDADATAGDSESATHATGTGSATGTATADVGSSATKPG